MERPSQHDGERSNQADDAGLDRSRRRRSSGEGAASALDHLRRMEQDRDRARPANDQSKD